MISFLIFRQNTQILKRFNAIEDRLDSTGVERSYLIFLLRLPRHSILEP